jgi:SAM-dependent methyltransferase
METLDTSAFEAFEATGWERQATGYDSFFRPITTRPVGALLDAAGVTGGMRVLDVGTGPGYVAGRAAERGAAATGVDIAPAMIALARTAWPAARFRTGDAHDLPCPSGSFDAVVANFAILHLGRPELAAREFARVLAPGGRVALTAWAEPERTPMLGAVASALAACGARPPADIPAGPPFFRFAADEELRDLLHGAGLADATVETIEYTHVVGDADAVWHGIVHGTVRTSALILRQPARVQRRIHAAFRDILESYRAGETIELPVAVKLASATRSSAGASVTR